MTRRTRSSKTLAKALSRSAGIRTINSELDFGEGLSLAEYEAIIQELQDLLYLYNTLLAELDAKGLRITELEELLGIFSEKMLNCVANRYGKTSLEYGMAGGTIRTKGKRRSPKATEQSPEPAPIPALNPDLPATNGKDTVVLMNA